MLAHIQGNRVQNSAIDSAVAASGSAQARFDPPPAPGSPPTAGSSTSTSISTNEASSPPGSPALTPPSLLKKMSTKIMGRIRQSSISRASSSNSSSSTATSLAAAEPYILQLLHSPSRSLSNSSLSGKMASSQSSSSISADGVSVDLAVASSVAKLVKRTPTAVHGSTVLPQYGDEQDGPLPPPVFPNGEDELPGYEPRPENTDSGAVVTGHFLVTIPASVPAIRVHSILVTVSGTFSMDGHAAANSKISCTAEKVEKLVLYEKYEAVEDIPLADPPSGSSGRDRYLVGGTTHKIEFKVELHKYTKPSSGGRFFSVRHFVSGQLIYSPLETETAPAPSADQAGGSAPSASPPINATALSLSMPAPMHHRRTTLLTPSHLLTVVKLREKSLKIERTTFFGAADDGKILWEISVPAECSSKEDIVVEVSVRVAEENWVDKLNRITCFFQEATEYRVNVLIETLGGTTEKKRRKVIDLMPLPRLEKTITPSAMENIAKYLVGTKLIDNPPSVQANSTAASSPPAAPGSPPASDPNLFRHSFTIPLGDQQHLTKTHINHDIAVKDVIVTHKVVVQLQYLLTKHASAVLGAPGIERSNAGPENADGTYSWIQGARRDRVLEMTAPVVISDVLDE